MFQIFYSLYNPASARQSKFADCVFVLINRKSSFEPFMCLDLTERMPELLRLALDRLQSDFGLSIPTASSANQNSKMMSHPKSPKSGRHVWPTVS